MTTYQSSKVAATVPARSGLGLVSVCAEYALTAALAAGDVIKMVKVPKGARVVDVQLSTTDLDTHGTPTIALDVGDDGDTDRFIAGSTIGQAGGVARLNSHAGHMYTYTEDDTIDVAVGTGPATGATTGTIRCTALYDMMN